MTILHPSQPFPQPFPKGAVLLVDKPLGWTSFDVVNKVRHALSRRLGVKRVKLGHAGTLDPLATGLLILCVGEYTKRIDYFQGLSKTYTGVITFGATTPSSDREKALNETFELKHLTDERLQAALPLFIGDIQQFPPIFSAVKVDGKRMYKSARGGREVEMESRAVHVESLEAGPLHPVQAGTSETVVLSERGATIYQYPDYAEGLQAGFTVRCSKGTYIRSLAFDLGQALQTGAYLSSLRRTGIGKFSVDDAWAVADLVAWVKG